MTDKLPRFWPDRAKRGRVPLKGVGGRWARRAAARPRRRERGFAARPTSPTVPARSSFYFSLEVLHTNLHVQQVLGYYNRALRLLRTILKCKYGR
jgi:hypothetical protein